MDKKFGGVFPALLTPFDKYDNINAGALGRLIELNINAGVSGFYVAGSTAEVFMLTDGERKLIYETAAKYAGGKVTLIAHIGAISTKQAIEYGKIARSLGYDAVSAISPFYYKFSFEQIKRHYFTISEAVGLPMIIYNFPNFSGVNLSVSDISQFLANPGFIGVKHTSSDYYALESFKAAFPDKVIYNGFDEMFLCGLSMGADGGIGSTYNFMADKFIRMKKKFEAGDMSGALEEQKTVNAVIDALKKVGVMEGEKEVLCQLGIDFGHARAPFSELDDAQKKIVTKEILPLL
jgi:N-acetylneuraminate lyase